MSQCGNNNELALQHGGFCTMWSFAAKGLFQMKTRTTGRHYSRSPKYTELTTGSQSFHVVLVQITEKQRFITHVHSHCQNVRHVRKIDLYLTRLALVPLCLHVVHSVRTSSGFFFFSAASASLLPGRLPLLGAEGSALDSTLGFC